MHSPSRLLRERNTGTIGPRQLEQRLATLQDVTTAIKNKEILCPNLLAILSPLAAASTDNYNELESRINSRIDDIINDDVILHKVKNVNLPLFISDWYPNCSFEAQEAMALYYLWLFVWDDVFDGEDIREALPLNMEAMFEKTINFVKYHLGLTELAAGELEPEAPTKATSIFKHAGVMLAQQTDREQRERFFEEIKFYILSCAYEHKTIERGVLPSVEEYWTYRLGTSSVYASCAIADHMAGVKLPGKYFENDDMALLWREANRNIVIVNDLLSLKKEINRSLHSLIPISMQDTGYNLQDAIDDLVNQLRDSVKKFQSLSARLLSSVAHDPQAKQELEKYIRLIQFNVTGNLSWSIGCDRYRVTDDLQADGSLKVYT
ncbi:hypothetical protein NLG97_g4261 [Lecanicillium saksenae]|uniref:Uncharacterized protein n=1 Tax=Lecanicillium saksenae TaxID=468837 RepID=A0ACC1QZP2_9HYPO|nr:hypothetical protein NLG97_g4261 [Lecanicillium saksenae]